MGVPCFSSCRFCPRSLFTPYYRVLCFVLSLLLSLCFALCFLSITLHFLFVLSIHQQRYHLVKLRASHMLDSSWGSSFSRNGVRAVGCLYFRGPFFSFLSLSLPLSLSLSLFLSFFLSLLFISLLCA